MGIERVCPVCGKHFYLKCNKSAYPFKVYQRNAKPQELFMCSNSCYKVEADKRRKYGRKT